MFVDSKRNSMIKIHGGKLSIIPDDPGISTELVEFKTHEPLTTELLKEELRRGCTVLDIGANIGYYTLLERKIVGKEGKVIAIDPSPLTFSYLRKNLLQNGFSDVDTFRLAFSRADGYCNFLIEKHSNLSRIVLNDIGRSSNEQCVKVRTICLDSFVERYFLKKLDFLRMDIEGQEIDVLIGGFRSIQKFKPILLIEVHKRLMGQKKTIDFLQILKNLGYNIKYYIPRELDMPFIGCLNDIHQIDLSELIEKIARNLVPDCFNLFLVNTSREVFF